jgi:RNA polymerase sigma-70 factor (ECF subfamily)
MATGPLPDHADFARLLAAAQAGSTEALGRLWQECRNYLLLVANERLDTDLHAKVSPSDLVQETFLEAQRDLAQFRGRCEEELLVWLGRILAHNAANVTRHYKATEMRAMGREVHLGTASDSKEDGQALPLDTPTPSDRLVAQEELAALQGALARLPGHYRQVLHLRYNERLPFATIGDRLSCSAEAARKLWARAVDLLEKELNPPEAS